MLKLNDRVKIKSTGKIGDIVDVTVSEPHGYFVEWYDDEGKWNGLTFGESDLERVDEDV